MPLGGREENSPRPPEVVCSRLDQAEAGRSQLVARRGGANDWPIRSTLSFASCTSCLLDRPVLGIDDEKGFVGGLAKSVSVPRQDGSSGAALAAAAVRTEAGRPFGNLFVRH